MKVVFIHMVYVMMMVIVIMMVIVTLVVMVILKFIVLVVVILTVIVTYDCDHDGDRNRGCDGDSEIHSVSDDLDGNCCL